MEILWKVPLALAGVGVLFACIYFPMAAHFKSKHVHKATASKHGARPYICFIALWIGYGIAIYHMADTLLFWVPIDYRLPFGDYGPLRSFISGCLAIACSALLPGYISEYARMRINELNLQVSLSEYKRLAYASASEIEQTDNDYLYALEDRFSEIGDLDRRRRFQSVSSDIFFDLRQEIKVLQAARKSQ